MPASTAAASNTRSTRLRTKLAGLWFGPHQMGVRTSLTSVGRIARKGRSAIRLTRATGSGSLPSFGDGGAQSTQSKRAYRTRSDGAQSLAWLWRYVRAASRNVTLGV